LLVDLDTAEEAMGRGDRETAHHQLGHAQAIVLELLASLEQGAWSGGAGLAQLYVWMVRHLVNANINQDTGALAHCRDLVTPLRDAWRDAAMQTSPGLGAAV
jgi:flagellar protein FliS